MSSLVEKFKRYPMVLWALGLYLCSLGFSFRMDVPLAILAFTAILFFGHHESQQPVLAHLRHHWHVLFFLGASALTTLHSRDMLHSLEIQVQLLPAILMYVIIVSAIATRDELDFTVAAIVIGGMVTGLAFFVRALQLTDLSDPLEKIYTIKSPLLVAPNDVLYFSAMAPLAIYLVFDAGRSVLIRIVSMFYLVVTFALAIYMQSRQATGVFLLAAFFYAVLQRPLYGGVVIAVGLVAILGIDWVSGKGLLKKLVYLFPRRYVWSAAWQMFLDRPLFGQGPGMFRILYPEFLEKAGYVLSQVEDRRPMNWAHSLYFEQLAERGMVGFVALITLAGKPVLDLVRRVAGLGQLDKSLLASMAALLLAGIAEASLSRLWVMALFFILPALFGAANKTGN